MVGLSAYEAGRHAFDLGVLKKHNPHPKVARGAPGWAAWRDWEKGWSDRRTVGAILGAAKVIDPQRL